MKYFLWTFLPADLYAPLYLIAEIYQYIHISIKNTPVKSHQKRKGQPLGCLLEKARLRNTSQQIIEHKVADWRSNMNK